jgi:hypothetical protein
MESKGSLPCSQEPATGPYSDTHVSSRILTPCSYKIHFNINSSPSRSPNLSLSLTFFHENFGRISCVSMCATCPVPLVLLECYGGHTVVIYGGEYNDMQSHFISNCSLKNYSCSKNIDYPELCVCQIRMKRRGSP